MRKILIFLLVTACAYLLFNSTYPALKKYIKAYSSVSLRGFSIDPESTTELPFSSGEKLVFFYSMGPLRIGTAELTFIGKTFFQEKEAFLIKFESQVGTFYDLEIIYAQPQTFYPIYVERSIKNIGLRTEIKEKYDQQNHKVEITKEGLLGKKTKVIEKKSPIHNALLLIYYCRSLLTSELKVGYEFDIVLPIDEFKVTLSSIEKIKTPTGEQEVYLFESNPKKIKLWIANDERHTPLKMENLTAIGPSSIVFEK